jgi:hypothetical protein
LEIDLDRIAIAGDRRDTRARQHRKADGHRVAQEQTRERDRDDAADAERLEPFRRRLPAASTSEVPARHDDVAGAHLDAETGIDRLQRVPRALGEWSDRVGAGRQRIGADVVAKPPRPAGNANTRPAPVHRVSCGAGRSMERGSAMRPRMALAATVAGDARKISACGLPMRPGKFRLWVPMQRSPAASTPPWPPKHGPQPVDRSSAPASTSVFEDALRHRLTLYLPGRGSDQQARARVNAVPGQDPGGDAQIFNPAVRARADKRLIDRDPFNRLDGFDVVDGVRSGDLRSERVQLHTDGACVAGIGVGAERGHVDVALAKVPLGRATRGEQTKLRAQFHGHVRERQAARDVDLARGRSAKFERLILRAVGAHLTGQCEDDVFPHDARGQPAGQFHQDCRGHLKPQFPRGQDVGHLGRSDAGTPDAQAAGGRGVRIGAAEKLTGLRQAPFRDELVADACPGLEEVQNFKITDVAADTPVDSGRGHRRRGYQVVEHDRDTGPIPHR